MANTWTPNTHHTQQKPSTSTFSPSGPAPRHVQAGAYGYGPASVNTNTAPNAALGAFPQAPPAHQGPPMSMQMPLQHGQNISSLLGYMAQTSGSPSRPAHAQSAQSLQGRSGVYNSYPAHHTPTHVPHDSDVLKLLSGSGVSSSASASARPVPSRGNFDQYPTSSSSSSHSQAQVIHGRSYGDRDRSSRSPPRSHDHSRGRSNTFERDRSRDSEREREREWGRGRGRGFRGRGRSSLSSYSYQYQGHRDREDHRDREQYGYGYGGKDRVRRRVGDEGEGEGEGGPAAKRHKDRERERGSIRQSQALPSKHLPLHTRYRPLTELRRRYGERLAIPGDLVCVDVRWCGGEGEGVGNASSFRFDVPVRFDCAVVFEEEKEEKEERADTVSDAGNPKPKSKPRHTVCVVPLSGYDEGSVSVNVKESEGESVGGGVSHSLSLHDVLTGVKLLVKKWSGRSGSGNVLCALSGPCEGEGESERHLIQCARKVLNEYSVYSEGEGAGEGWIHLFDCYYRSKEGEGEGEEEVVEKVSYVIPSVWRSECVLNRDVFSDIWRKREVRRALDGALVERLKKEKEEKVEEKEEKEKEEGEKEEKEEEVKEEEEEVKEEKEEEVKGEEEEVKEEKEEEVKEEEEKEEVKEEKEEEVKEEEEEEKEEEVKEEKMTDIVVDIDTDTVIDIDIDALMQHIPQPIQYILKPHTVKEGEKEKEDKVKKEGEKLNLNPYIVTFNTPSPSLSLSTHSTTRPMVISLDGLLDYDQTDVGRSSFELSVFAECVLEMLLWRKCRDVYRGVCRASDRVKVKEKGKVDSTTTTVVDHTLLSAMQWFDAHRCGYIRLDDAINMLISASASVSVSDNGLSTGQDWGMRGCGRQGVGMTYNEAMAILGPFTDLKGKEKRSDGEGDGWVEEDVKKARFLYKRACIYEIEVEEEEEEEEKKEEKEEEKEEEVEKMEED